MGRINPDREITLGAATYTLRYTIDALTEIEERIGEPCTKIFTKMDKGELSFKELHAILFAGIEFHHPKVGFKKFGQSITPGDLSDGDVVDTLSEALNASLPQPKPDDKEKEDTEKDKDAPEQIVR